jgi:hypothetical protein
LPPWKHAPTQASAEEDDAKKLEQRLHTYYSEIAAAQQDQRDISDQVLFRVEGCGLRVEG